MNENKILILGMGNDILTDDGIGIKITKVLEKKFPFPNIIYDTLSLGGLEIIEYIKDFKMVILIDAIKTLNGILPGLFINSNRRILKRLHTYQISMIYLS